MGLCWPSNLASKLLCAVRISLLGIKWILWWIFIFTSMLNDFMFQQENSLGGKISAGFLKVIWATNWIKLQAYIPCRQALCRTMLCCPQSIAWPYYEGDHDTRHPHESPHSRNSPRHDHILHSDFTFPGGPGLLRIPFQMQALFQTEDWNYRTPLLPIPSSSHPEAPSGLHSYT